MATCLLLKRCGPVLDQRDRLGGFLIPGGDRRKNALAVRRDIIEVPTSRWNTAEQCVHGPHV